MKALLDQRLPSFCLVVFSLIFSACTHRADYILPLQEFTAFSESGQQALPERWWLAFDSQELAAHIETALQNNWSLAAAYERMEASRAVAERERSSLFPEFNLVGGASSSWDEEGSRSSLLGVGVAASYEVDLWKRVRASRRAEDLRAAASEELYRAAALSLSGEIAVTWVRLLEAGLQKRLLQSQLETNEMILAVLEARFGVGLIRSADVLRQKLLIESIREEMIVVDREAEILGHQLAVLKGLPPPQEEVQTGFLPVLPPLPDTGLPAALVNRRPDIQATLLAVAAADQDLAVALRDRYPQLTLSASYISETTKASHLFSDWIASIAADFVAPLFDGGQRRAEVRRAEAVRGELIALYGEDVLRAFQEVEDALTSERKQRKRVSNLNLRQSLAETTLSQLRQGYFSGATDFVSVLLAQVQLDTIERERLRAQRDAVLYRIGLYRALAGGFPTPREIARDSKEEE